MKMIMAVVSGDDSNAVSAALTKARFSVTKLATTGGFLMSGNTTFLIGVDDDKVSEVIDIIAKHSKKRKQMVPSAGMVDVGMYSAFPVEVTVGGAIVFVMNVERFEKV
ncbi:MAG: cyclic-di-AMP receptor [Oscillospiraceae bacterium]|nr:cyclic-di-AMP receptor [Oscillospiraceae bacterium]